jgi:hypothetical protein
VRILRPPPATLERDLLGEANVTLYETGPLGIERLASAGMERIDLGPCRAIRHEGDDGRVAVLLPGQFYPTRAPALWFAREAAMARRWSALEVLGEPGEHEDPLTWERWCAEREVPGDPVMSLAGLRQMTEAVMRFADRA